MTINSVSVWSGVQSTDVFWEAEPNDVLAQVNGPIVSGLVHQAAFPTIAGEQDCFHVRLPADGSVEPWLTNIPAGYDRPYLWRVFHN